MLRTVFDSIKRFIINSPFYYQEIYDARHKLAFKVDPLTLFRCDSDRAGPKSQPRIITMSFVLKISATGLHLCATACYNSVRL